MCVALQLAGLPNEFSRYFSEWKQLSAFLWHIVCLHIDIGWLPWENISSVTSIIKVHWVYTHICSIRHELDLFPRKISNICLGDFDSFPRKINNMRPNFCYDNITAISICAMFVLKKNTTQFTISEHVLVQYGLGLCSIDAGNPFSLEWATTDLSITT